MKLSRLALTTTTVLVLFAGAAQALTFKTNTASIRPDDTGHLLSNGEIAEYIEIHEAGLYAVRVVALGQPLGGVWPIMALSVDTFTAEEISVDVEAWVEYNFQTWFDPGIYTIGVAYLNDEMNEFEDRNLGLDQITIEGLSGHANPSFADEGDWLADAIRRENALVDATTETIKELRMGGATVYVVDGQGNPVPDATVTVAQETHDFLFGASFAGFQTFGDPVQNALYEEKFADVFNYATLPFYWPTIEPVEGYIDYPRLDSMVAWCEDNGVAMKGHALLWAWEPALPSWMDGMPSLAQMEAHVSGLLERYGDRIDAWEIVNEPFNEPGIDFAVPHEWARALAPDSLLVVNEYGQLYNGLLGFWDMVEAGLDAGVPIDAVGIQAHAPTDTAYPMERVRDILDLYGQLGVDVHITELTPSSGGMAVTGAPWRNVWDEATQADYAEKFYRISFAHPAVTAISWWDFSDHGAWVPGGGLLRADLSEKPAYAALKRLITEEWNTRTSGQTYIGGGFYFNGYFGEYTVDVEYEGQTTQATFHVRKGAENTITVAVDGVAPANPVAVTVDPLETNDSTPTLTGTVTNAEQVSVTLDNATFHQAVVSGGAWQVSISNPLEDGVYDVRAIATGANGSAVEDDTSGELVIDTTPPVITLNGDTAMEIEEGEAYEEPGYTATDTRDGDLTGKVVVSGSVDTANAGDYTLTYTVSDAVGNTASRTRHVTVTAAPKKVAVGVIGDLNNDGVINHFDTTLLGYLNNWGEARLNRLLRLYGMNTVDARLADIDQNGTVDGWDHTLHGYVMEYGLETVNDYLASTGQPLARMGETLYEYED